ncbi:MAG: hypothetical protein ACRD0U_03940, partial [Acidimicrobiales bacterium]
MVGLGLLFVALGVVAAVADTWLFWDRPIQHAVESNRTAWLDRFFLTVSTFGGTMAVLVLGGLTAALTWRRCRA